MRDEPEAALPATIQRFSTKTVPQSARLNDWYQTHRKQSEVLRISRASNDDFEGECVSATLGPVSVRRTASTPVRIELTAEAIGKASIRRYFLLMPTIGRLRVRYDDRESTLGVGDIVLLDTWTPSVVQTDERNESITVGIDPATLASHLPEAEFVAGIPLGGQLGAGLLASTMLRSVSAALEHGLIPEAGPRLAASLLEVVATSYLAEHVVDSAASSRGALSRLRAKRIIEHHLRDPELTPKFVADALGVSTRYLRMLFENHGEPMSRYILRRRLEKCAEHLRFGGKHDATLTTIAFSYGFSSMAHFSRVFRERFDMTAGHYRTLHAQAHAGAAANGVLDAAASLSPAFATNGVGPAASGHSRAATRN